jgi:peptidyl-dipeptidase A
MSIFSLLLWAGGIMTTVAAPSDETATSRAKKFITEHEKKIRPLDIAMGEAWWRANTSGSDEDFKKKEEMQNKIDEALANKESFKEIKAIHEMRDKIDDKIVRRCVDVLYLIYLEKAVDTELLKKISAKANAVEKAFNTFRAKVDGKELTDSEVRKVLATKWPNNSASRRFTL